MFRPTQAGLHDMCNPGLSRGRDADGVKPGAAAALLCSLPPAEVGRMACRRPHDAMYEATDDHEHNSTAARRLILIDPANGGVVPCLLQ